MDEQRVYCRGEKRFSRPHSQNHFASLSPRFSLENSASPQFHTALMCHNHHEKPRMGSLLPHFFTYTWVRIATAVLEHRQERFQGFSMSTRQQDPLPQNRHHPGYARAHYYHKDEVRSPSSLRSFDTALNIAMQAMNLSSSPGIFPIASHHRHYRDDSWLRIATEDEGSVRIATVIH